MEVAMSSDWKLKNSFPNSQRNKVPLDHPPPPRPTQLNNINQGRVSARVITVRKCKMLNTFCPILQLLNITEERIKIIT